MNIIQKQTGYVKRLKYIVIPLVFVVGIATVALAMVNYEKKQNMRDIYTKGNYLVSLIATHPISSLENERREIVLKTLARFTYPEGVAYCIIHDDAGLPMIVLTPKDMAAKIPSTVKTKSLYAAGLTQQKYRLIGSKNTFYEFALPMFEKGQKTGTVRVGLDLPVTSFFSIERISLLAMICFLIFAAITFVYYGISQVLRPLAQIPSESAVSKDDSAASVENPQESYNIQVLVQRLGQALTRLKKQLKETESDNVELATRLGVATFEKNQIINILDATNYGVVITDIQNNITHVNTFALNLMNKKLADVLDHPVAEALSNKDITQFASQKETTQAVSTPNHIETTFTELAPDETFRVTFSYLQDEDGTPIGKMISLKDITHEKLGEETMKEFVTQLSHELRTPLTTITAYNEMLMDGEIQDPEVKKEFYNTIRDETSRLTQLIHNLLNMSKIEMGGLAFNKELVRTDGLFQDCLSAAEAAAHKKQIKVEKLMPDNFPTLVGDKEQLKVAINNVLSNAVKYTPENGSIRFSLNESDQHVIFEISDTGYGISPEDRPRIFDKTYRSSDPRIVEQPGSGFGLAITEAIINQHSGTLEVESEPDKGTHITIRIPQEAYDLGSQ
jgi:two-component system sensor histidine kinase VicK